MIYPSELQTTAAVALHYDELDAFYREIWGDHVHHGYWETGTETPKQAVEALVDLLAHRLKLSAGMQVCDVGCGYGATALRLAELHSAHVTGVTVSAAQALRAKPVPVRGSVTILQQDWLDNRFVNEQFDRVISVESSEHMPDKQRFFDEAFRVLKPGGRLGILAWLARSDPRPWEVRHLLEPICREGRLPSMGDESDYLNMARASGFDVESNEDLSERVSRTWRICLQRGAKRVLTDSRYSRFLFDDGAKNRVFALTMLRLMIAYQTGSMRYCLLLMRK